MRVTELHISGFRSIHELHMKGLGAAVVLYGQNGSGKSNILEALRVLVLGVRELVGRGCPIDEAGAVDIGAFLTENDFELGGEDAIRIGATFGAEPGVLPLKLAPIRGIELEITALLGPGRRSRAWITKLYGFVHRAPIDLLPLLHVPTHPEIANHEELFKQLRRTLSGDEIVTHRNQLRSWLVQTFPTQFRHIADLRARDREEPLARKSSDLPAMLAAGDIPGAFVTAHQHPRPEVRARFELLRKVLTEPPLSLPTFDAVRNLDGTPEIQARSGTNGAVPLRLAGLGTQQLVFIITSMLLEPVSIVTLEEPEAHLHAPTSGRALRKLLAATLAEGHVNQIFVATHSNLFDLDREGYWHVSRGTEGTKAEYRTDLAGIDRDHLWEPGPAKHALEDILRIVPEEIVARLPNGDPISGQDMIRMLQEDTDEARDFCQAIVRSAVRLVRMQSARKA